MRKNRKQKKVVIWTHHLKRMRMARMMKGRRPWRRVRLRKPPLTVRRPNRR